MPNNIFAIYKKHLSKKSFDNNLQYLTLFANYNNILKHKNNFIHNDNYKGIFKTKLNNHKYEINFYDIKETDKTIIMFNYSSDLDNYCISAKVEKNNPDILTIITLESLPNCYQTSDKTDLERKKGSILMQIIIKWAKQNNYKKIYLDDTSTYKCSTQFQTIYYDLKHVHTLTDGYPWYYKFGFRFVNLKDNEKVKINYNKLKLIKTSDIKFVDIIKCIAKYTIDDNKYKYFNDKETIINLYNLTDLYETNYNENIMKFFKNVSKESCIMMSLLWNYIFNLLKLNKYETFTMELNLT